MPLFNDAKNQVIDYITSWTPVVSNTGSPTRYYYHATYFGLGLKDHTPTISGTGYAEPDITIYPSYSRIRIGQTTINGDTSVIDTGNNLMCKAIAGKSYNKEEIQFDITTEDWPELEWGLLFDKDGNLLAFGHLLDANGQNTTITPQRNTVPVIPQKGFMIRLEEISYAITNRLTGCTVSGPTIVSGSGGTLTYRFNAGAYVPTSVVVTGASSSTWTVNGLQATLTISGVSADVEVDYVEYSVNCEITNASYDKSSEKFKYTGGTITVTANWGYSLVAGSATIQNAQYTESGDTNRRVYNITNVTGTVSFIVTAVQNQ